MVIPPLHPGAIAGPVKHFLSYLLTIEAIKKIGQLKGSTRVPNESVTRLAQRDEERRWIGTRDQLSRRHSELLDQNRQSLDIQKQYWPLKIDPNTFCGLGSEQSVRPLIMTYIPPVLSDPHLMDQIQMQNERWIGDILRDNFSPADPIRPVRFLSGWDRGRARDTSAMELLYDRAPDVPTALIQIDHIGDSLQLVAGAYGFGEPGAVHPPIFSESGSVSWERQGSAITRENIARLQQLVRSLPEGSAFDLTRLGENGVNLALLELEQASGQRLDGHFQLTSSNLRAAAEAVGPALQLLAVGMADFFHWQRNRAAPRLPALLGRIAARFPEAMQTTLTAEVLRHYEQTYVSLAATADGQTPALLIDLSESMAQAPNGVAVNASRRVLEQAIEAFCRLKNLSNEISLVDYVQFARAEDRLFLTRVSEVWRVLGDTDRADALSQTLNDAGPRVLRQGERLTWTDLVEAARR